MKRHELGMSLDYPANWKAEDAIREILQNCIDEEIERPENKWYIDYNEETETLKVGNKLSKLLSDTLLLGVSTKRDNNKTIGKHGEGYKVGTNVLLREGLGVTVYNYTMKEIWHAKVINSRTYKTRIAVFDIEKVRFFESVPEQSLIFEITGVTKEIYDRVVERTLFLQKPEDIGETIECEEFGRILLNPKFKGKLYVKGLYVCDKSQMELGYDLNPALIDLDRDRGVVDSFDLQWSLGKVLITVKNKDFLKKYKDSWDAYYIKSVSLNSINPALQELCNESLEDFHKKYGNNAFPCEDTGTYNYYRAQGINAILVSSTDYYYIKHADSFKGVETSNFREPKNLSKLIDDWFSEASKYLPKELRKRGDSVMLLVKQTINN